MTRDEKIKVLETLKSYKDRGLPINCMHFDNEGEVKALLESVYFADSWDNVGYTGECKIITALEAHLDEEVATYAAMEESLTEADLAPQHLGPFAPAPRPVAPPPSALATWQMLVDNWRATGRTLPVDSAQRKLVPIDGGHDRYFPAAIVCIAAWSKFNNEKHNPGEPLHHSRGKSGDQEECLARHSIDIGDAQVAKDDLTELEEATAVAWRANARLQILCERLGAPPAPAARFPNIPEQK